MKKATVIVYAEYIEKTDTVLIQYESGTVRKYPMDKLPKTIAAYVEAHPELIAGEDDEQGKEVWSVEVRDGLGHYHDVFAGDTMEECVTWLKESGYYDYEEARFIITHYAADSTVIEEYDRWDLITAEAKKEEEAEETGFVLVETPTTDFVLVDASECTALVPVNMTSALVPVTRAEGTEAAPDEVTEPRTAEKLAGVAAMVGRNLAKVAEKAAKAIAINAPTILHGAVKIATTAAPVVARATVKATAWTVDRLVSLYYLVTTYCPILARWIMVHTAWAVQDVLPYILTAIKATWMGTKAAGIGAARAASMVAGWLLVAALATISASIKAGRMISEGWQMRREIIEEQRA